MNLSNVTSTNSRANGIKTKKQALSSSKPFICYKWKDIDLNQFISLEILLNCSGEVCTVELEEIGGCQQAIVLTQSLPRSWLNMDYFRSKLDMRNNYNDSQRLAARADYMKAMSHKYGENSREDLVMSKQYFKLPFRCDDINVRGGYPGTGYSEDIWPVLGRKKVVMKGNSYVEEREELGFVNVLTINLVAEEKYQKRNDNTPKKKKLSAAFNNYDSDDGGGGVYVDTSSYVNRSSVGVGNGGGGNGHTSFATGTAGRRRVGRSRSVSRNNRRSSGGMSVSMQSAVGGGGTMNDGDDDADMSFDGSSYHYDTPTANEVGSVAGFADDNDDGL